MDDPNTTYKASFRELADTLGRTPTANELLPLHEAYKKAFLALPSEVEKADKEYAMRLQHNMGRAAGPDQEGFSRKPAPQARTEGEEAREAAREPLSGPRTNPTREGAVSEPAPALNKPRPSERPITGSRGVNGGIQAVCRKCGRDFERPARRGRPPVMCEECR